MKDYERFKDLKFIDFKSLALDGSLSIYQKIGFPDSYRINYEEKIFEDILNKLELHENMGPKTILDIGTGCSKLPILWIDFSIKMNNNLIFVDHKEMLDLIPNSEKCEKYYGYFPNETPVLIEKYSNKIDFISCYSVIQYVFNQTCIYQFLDSAISMLAPKGKLLLGDIPNHSKRNRFFTSENGILFHQKYMNTNETPSIDYFNLNKKIDDSIIFGILLRYRNLGYETYLLPQNSNLPMSNRREDILICKP